MGKNRKIRRKSLQNKRRRNRRGKYKKKKKIKIKKVKKSKNKLTFLLACLAAPAGLALQFPYKTDPQNNGQKTKKNSNRKYVLCYYVSS